MHLRLGRPPVALIAAGRQLEEELAAGLVRTAVLECSCLLELEVRKTGLRRPRSGQTTGLTAGVLVCLTLCLRCRCLRRGSGRDVCLTLWLRCRCLMRSSRIDLDLTFVCLT